MTRRFPDVDLPTARLVLRAWRPADIADQVIA